MNRYRTIIMLAFFAFILKSCSKPTLENPFYNPYFERAHDEEHFMMQGVLDTISMLFQKIPPGIKDRATFYKLKSKYYKNIAAYDSSLVIQDSLRILLQDKKDDPVYREMYAGMLLSMVENYTLLKQYNRAMDFSISAKQFIGTNISNRCLSSQYYNNIASLLMTQGRQKMAISYLLMSYKDAQSCTNNLFDRFYTSYSSLSTAGLCYMEVKMYDSAQYYYNAARNYVISNEPEFPEKAKYFALCKAVINYNEALLKKSLGLYDEAAELLRSSIDATAQVYPSHAFSCRIDLADTYLQSGNAEKAKQLLNFLDTVRYDNLTITAFQKYRINKYHKDYYNNKGDYQKALLFANKALNYHDSIELANKYNIARDPGLEFENREHIAANELLKTQYDRRTVHFLISVLLIILVLIVTTFILLHLKRTARHARMLEYLNHEINLKNADIKDAYISLENSYRTTERLMLMVAHDLKNPIVGITNLAKLLIKKASASDLKENLGYIVTASANAAELINDLMIRNERKYEAAEKGKYDMLHLIKYCVEIMKPRARQKKQRLLLKGESVDVLINKNEMWRVITNLINNAVKFSYENSNIEILLQKQESKLLVSVKDHGIGIPKDFLENIFIQESEIQRAGTAGEPSYGLGLKISKRIVEQHQGLLWAESTEGKGSTFFIMLPATEN